MSAVTTKSLWNVYGARDDAQRAREMSRLAHGPVCDGRGQQKRAEAAWDRVYHDVIVAIVTSMPSRAPEGICHLAADVADAATAERQRRGKGAL